MVHSNRYIPRGGKEDLLFITIVMSCICIQIGNAPSNDTTFGFRNDSPHLVKIILGKLQCQSSCGSGYWSGHRPQVLRSQNLLNSVLLLFFRTTNQCRKNPSNEYFLYHKQTWVDLGRPFDATFLQVARFRIRKLHNAGSLESYFKISEISQSVHCCT